MKKIVLSSLIGMCFIMILVVVLPTFAINQDTKCIKLKNGNEMIKYSHKNLIEKDIKDVNSLDVAKYDLVMIKKDFLSKPNVKKKMRDVLESGNQVLVLGDKLSEKELLGAFGLENSVTYNSYKPEFVSKTVNEENSNADRIDNFIKPNEKVKEEFCAIGIGLYDINEKVPYVSLIPAGLTQKETDELINDIMNTTLDEVRSNLNKDNGKVSLNWDGNPALALTSTPFGSTLKKTYSYSSYYAQNSTTLFKYQRVGKLYKENDEDDPTYNYYWFATSDILKSGDYLYNNGYEVDGYLIKNYPSGGTGQRVMEFSPDDTSSTSYFDVSLGLQGVGVSWTFNAGGSTSVITDGGNGESYTTWYAYPGAPKLWLTSAFKFETGMEYRINDSDSSFSNKSGINVDVERDLTMIGTFTKGDSLSISDN